jgi:threonine/homoserine/homoserine lactone efflux protein
MTIPSAVHCGAPFGARYHLVMPSGDSLLTFALLAFALIVIPGPSVMFVVSRAVALGRRAALLTALGNAFGVYLQVVVIAFGLGAILERSITAYTIMKLAGAAYLVWLGIQAIRHRGGAATRTAGDTESTASHVLRQGVIVGVSNPKSLAFFAAVLPQFVNLEGVAIALQIGFLGLLFVLIALLSDSVWSLAAGSARDWFGRSPKRLGWLGAAGGVIMIGLGLQLALTGRSD